MQGLPLLSPSDSLPGRQGAECYFFNCQYWDGVRWEPAELYDGHWGGVESDDDDEWGIVPVDNTTFYIWDKDPLPNLVPGQKMSRKEDFIANRRR